MEKFESGWNPETYSDSFTMIVSRNPSGETGINAGVNRMSLARYPDLIKNTRK